MTDEPSNGELKERIESVNGAITDLRLVVANLGIELRSYIRELLSNRDELHTERLRSINGRLERLEKDAEERDRRDEQRERERAKEVAEHHRTKLTIFWGGAFMLLAAVVTVVLTTWTSHGGTH